MRVAPSIVLTDQERAELKKLVGSKLTSVRLAQRARIVLLAAEEMQNSSRSSITTDTAMKILIRKAARVTTTGRCE